MKIIFRADGDNLVGLGHIMRSAALMQMLQPGFQCEFWTNNPEYFPYADFSDPAVVLPFACAGIEDESKQLAARSSADDIIVLDGYQFKSEYQLALKQKGLTVVCIDDLIRYHYFADVIINHAGGVSDEEYSKEQYTRVFSGPAYALVKPLFFKQQRPVRNLENKEIFVSLGGADTHNRTDMVLPQLIESSFSSIHVVIGAANRHYSGLLEKYSAYKDLHFYRDLSASAIYELMKRCTYALLTPSTICYEYMSVGGIVYLYQTADNQERVKEYFLSEKLAFPFESLQEFSKVDMIYSMERQKEIFDRKSPERFVDIFSGLAKSVADKEAGIENHG